MLLASVAAAWLAAAPAPAQAVRAIPAQDLAGALSQLAREANIELLFDRRVLAGRRAAAVGAGLTADQALSQLLAGTGLAYRRLDAGTYVIQAAPIATARQAEPPRTVTEVAELLVVGKRTLNTDLRRSIDDIQPYQVFDAQVIAAAQPNNLEDFFRTQTSSQTLDPAFSQAPKTNLGSARSQIDLRGLGADQTLVLIDGRRLPSNPGPGNFSQPDINGLSPGDIDRIEILGSSAGGIFGVGAAGGAVNIVLKREFDGAEVRLTGGQSSRGDARRWEAAGRFGVTSPGGGTRLMLSAARSQDDGLEFGDRGYIVDARRRRAQQVPNPRESVASPSFNYNSVTGAPLTLRPAYGGGALNATTTTLPLDAPPLASGGVAVLLANAGQYDINLSPDGQGVRQSLVTPTRTTSLLGTLRQSIGARVEAYVDVLWLENDGRAAIPAVETASNILEGGQTGNPFNQRVSVTYPTPGVLGAAWTDSRTSRISSGLIARLDHDWTVNLDAAAGRAAVRDGVDAIGGQGYFDTTQGGGALSAYLAGLAVAPFARQRSETRLYDLSVRAAGPVVQLPNGPLVLTATAEWRREDLAATDEGAGGAPEEKAPRKRQAVGSVFFEARAPIFDGEAPVAALRGLELQLALRGDRYAIRVPAFAFGSGRSEPVGDENRASILATTFGASAEPLSGLTFRASVATGATAPTPSQLLAATVENWPQVFVDPRRGAPASMIAPLTLSLGGSPTLKPQRTTTLALGVVARPQAVPGLRVSVDYSRLRTVDEISDFAQFNTQYFIDHEAAYPGRVARAPLTPADVALGYTAGQITAVDTSLTQVGTSVLQAVDFAVDYQHGLSSGEIHAYARGTWTPSFRRRSAPDQPAFDLVGHADGPLPWRGNVGLEWTRGAWSSGLNVQFYGPFSGYLGEPPNYFQLLTVLNGGVPVEGDGANATRIPAQAYLDWTLSWRTHAPGGRAALEYRFGVRNVFDTRPPVVAGSVAQRFQLISASSYDYDPLGGYAPMGDARGRRFELSLVSRF